MDAWRGPRFAATTVRSFSRDPPRVPEARRQFGRVFFFFHFILSKFKFFTFWEFFKDTKTQPGRAPLFRWRVGVSVETRVSDTSRDHGQGQTLEECESVISERKLADRVKSDSVSARERTPVISLSLSLLKLEREREDARLLAKDASSQRARGLQDEECRTQAARGTARASATTPAACAAWRRCGARTAARRWSRASAASSTTRSARTRSSPAPPAAATRKERSRPTTVFRILK